MVGVLLILLLSSTTVSAQLVSLSIDLQRNLQGSSPSSVIGIEGEAANLYFLASGDAAHYSSYSVSGLDQAGSAVSLIDLKTLDAVILRLTVNPLLSSQLATDVTLMVNGSSSALDLVFQIAPQLDLTLLSCKNDGVLLKVPSARDGERVTVLGKENVADCDFIISLPASKELIIPMAACALSYDLEFVLRFTALAGFEGVDEDVNMRLTCQRITTTFLMSNQDMVSRYEAVAAGDDMIYEQVVQAVMFLHAQGVPSNVISSGGVEVRTPVTLRIEMDDLYKNQFDILPLQCSANNQLIVDNGCSVYPFANFTREGPGTYRSDFNMFRTITNGIGDESVNFNCVMYVCQSGDCGSLPCISNE